MTKRTVQSRDRPRAFDPIAFLANSGDGRVISKSAPKAKIFAQGDVADSVFYIRKGKVNVVSTEGKEAVRAILDADEFVGEGCMIGQTKRLATAGLSWNVHCREK
jgi:CRP-like cAMP-binding protein